MSVSPSGSGVLVLRFRGGLGNQLFEYAAARSLALRNQVPLWLDTTSGFNDDRYGRSYELGAFNIVDERSGAEIPSAFDKRSVLYRAFLRGREYLGMRFHGRYFDSRIYNLRITRPVLLNSYCQSYRYFSDIENVLKPELEFKTIPSGLNWDLVSDIEGSNAVCLHARRLFANLADGSAQQSVAEYYGACGLAYYRRSLQLLASSHGPLRVFLFSDDIRWARQNAGDLEQDNCRVQVVDESDSLRNFYLMRFCRHFIIANSTYSWWAAWLGKYPNKTVCAPSVWNNGQRRFPRDLLPADWKIVPAGSPGDGETSALDTVRR